MANVVYSGPQTNALVGKETTFGTAVTADKAIGYVSSLNVTERNNVAKSNSIGSRSSQSIVATMADIDGTIESDLQIGRLLAYGMGTDSVGGATDITHTMAVAASLSPFTLMVSHDSSADIVRTYGGCIIKSFRVSGDLGNPLKASFDFSAANVSVATTGTGTYTNTTDTVLAPQFGTLSLYSANVAQVQSIDFSMDNNVTYQHALGHRVATAPTFGVRNIDLKATLNFEDAEGITDYKNFLADSASPYTTSTTDALDVTSGAGSITYTNGVSQGSGLRKWVVNLSALKINDYSISSPVDGVVTADLSCSVLDFTGTAMQYVDSNTSAYL